MKNGKNKSRLIKIASIILMLVLSLSSFKFTSSALSGNGLFAEYFQYRDENAPFSAADKRYETDNDSVDKLWKNSSYKKYIKNNTDTISYKLLKVTTLSSGVAQSDVKFMKTDKMAVRWSGFLCPTSSKQYAFRIRGNGGVSFYLIGTDKKRLREFKNWMDGAFLGDTVLLGKTSSVSLKANIKYPILIEYFNANFAAKIIFEWSSDGGKTWKPVPKTVLFSSASNRTVSIKTLSSAYQEKAKSAQQKLSKTLSSSTKILTDPTMNQAQEIAKDMLGQPASFFIDTATSIRKGGLETTIINKLGKVVFGELFKPVKAAQKFIDIYTSLFNYAIESQQSDAKRAIGFLLVRENGTWMDLPKGYREYCSVFTEGQKLGNWGNLGDKSFFYNMGRLAGTGIENQSQELTFLLMSVVAESYIFIYKDYIQMII